MSTVNILEAARSYLRKGRWARIFREASRAGRRKGIRPEVLDREIAAYRREKRK
jgi:hypothetical protein